MSDARSRAELARDYFLEGYACAQAVAMPFAEAVGLPRETLARLMLPFGAGVGRLRMTCGAVSAMAAIVGLLSDNAENTPENKDETYRRIRTLCQKLEQDTGSLICAQLLESSGVTAQTGGTPEARTQAYYDSRPCAAIVFRAAQLLEEYLEK